MPKVKNKKLKSDLKTVETQLTNECAIHTEIMRVDQEEIKKLQQWVNDLQSGMYINCVYCGHRYGPRKSTPVAMADVLKKHIEICPKHPMSKLRSDLEAMHNKMHFYCSHICGVYRNRKEKTCITCILREGLEE